MFEIAPGDHFTILWGNLVNLWVGGQDCHELSLNEDVDPCSRVSMKHRVPLFVSNGLSGISGAKDV